MLEILFWIYLVNSVLLINHEIDSAYRYVCFYNPYVVY
jgi:hypothetical protein